MKIEHKDPFVYVATEEAIFERNLSNIGNYKRITTFYSDLSIAEFYGVESIKETFDTVCEQWLDDYKFFTEFVICLNQNYNFGRCLALSCVAL